VLAEQREQPERDGGARGRGRGSEEGVEQHCSSGDGGSESDGGKERRRECGRRRPDTESECRRDERRRSSGKQRR